MFIVYMFLQNIMYIIFLYYVFFLIYKKFYVSYNKIFFWKKYFLNLKLQFTKFLLNCIYSIFLKKMVVLRFHLKWQPLFKKTSYFGIYRVSRQWWLNKTEEFKN